MDQDIATRDYGYRLVAGTAWPVDDVVQRQQYGARVRWVVLRCRCNGTAEGAEVYKTRREALTAL